MRRVPTVLVPAQHFNKTNFQEIVEGTYVFDECTNVKINTHYCKNLQLITEHQDLFLVSMFVFCRALSCLVLAIWPNNLGSASKIVEVNDYPEVAEFRLSDNCFLGECLSKKNFLTDTF